MSPLLAAASARKGLSIADCVGIVIIGLVLAWMAFSSI
jgi:hypothetical protein